MKFVHVFFCFLFLSLLCTFFDSVTLESAKSICQKPIIPGVAKMAHGIDLTILDLTYSNENRSQTLPLFEYTCIKNRIWRNYDCPDQVETFTLIDSIEPEVSSLIGNGSAYFKESRCQAVGLENECSVGAFSQSDSLQRIEESLYQLNQSIAEVSHCSLCVPTQH